MSSNSSNQSLLDDVSTMSRAKYYGAMDPVVVVKTVRRRRRAYIMPLISLSQSVDLYEGFSSRAKYYGSMAAKRLQTMHYANIAAAIEVEKKVPTDSMDQITRSITQKLVVACVQDLSHQNSAFKIVDPVVVVKTVRRRRRAYIMPLISLSHSVDLYEGFSSRAKYYGFMAAKRLQTMYYANIAAAIEVEKKVLTDLVNQITRSIIWKPVVACVQDLPLAACVQDLPHQNSASKIVDLVVTKITAQHGRRSMPSISSSRSVDSDDESCTSRADFNGVAAVNRIKTYHSMSNIAVT